jgi:hypothetical protein
MYKENKSTNKKDGLLDEYISSFPLSSNPFVNHSHLEISLILKEKSRIITNN